MLPHGMKAKTFSPLAVLLISLLWAVAGGQAQSYEVSWFTVDGGGGVSSGAGYSVAGTAGQPDAGMTSGGAFTLAGGFWSLYAPSRSAPMLRIDLVGTNAIISWPNPSEGYTLQETPTLDGAVISWSNANQTPGVVGNKQQVTVPANTGNRFYRLKN